jgi:transposase
MEKLDGLTILKLRTMQRSEKDRRRYVKITVVLMLDGGFSVEEVAFAFGIDAATVYRYLERYERASTLDEYLNSNYTGSEPNLTAEQVQVLEGELNSRLYSSAKEICALIEERFAVSYTPSGVLALLKRMGFVYKKTRQVPSKADPVAQEAFLAAFHRLVDASAETDSFYFCDAVHPQHNTRASNGWIKSGREFRINANSGRSRVNINGALNAHDVSDVVVRSDDRIDSDSTIALLEELQQRRPRGMIYVICDNARYYRSRAVREWLEGSRIALMFLPSYSPNLNLIERLWKYLRKKIIDPIYYPSNEIFREAILRFFRDIKDHYSALKPLLTLNFHIA